RRRGRARCRSLRRALDTLRGIGGAARAGSRGRDPRLRRRPRVGPGAVAPPQEPAAEPRTRADQYGRGQHGDHAVRGTATTLAGGRCRFEAGRGRRLEPGPRWWWRGVRPTRSPRVPALRLRVPAHLAIAA